MTLPAWEEQGYHFAGMLITFSFAWLGICVAITVEKCSPKATSCLNLFAGGGNISLLLIFKFLYGTRNSNRYSSSFKFPRPHLFS